MERHIGKDKAIGPIDIAGDGVPEDATEIIKVGRHYYRVVREYLDASPADYSRGWLEGVEPRFCTACGVALGCDLLPWTSPDDVRCVVHNADDGERHSTGRNPFCVFCGKKMIVAFPFEAPLHHPRVLWVCPHRCTWLVSRGKVKF